MNRLAAALAATLLAAAAAARLDQGEGRHLHVGRHAFDERHLARAVGDEGHQLPRLEELGLSTFSLIRLISPGNGSTGTAYVLLGRFDPVTNRAVGNRLSGSAPREPNASWSCSPKGYQTPVEDRQHAEVRYSDSPTGF